MPSDAPPSDVPPDDPSRADAPTEEPVDEPVSEAPRLLPPSGAAPHPPMPQVVARLPWSTGGGPSYADNRPPSYLFLAVVAVLSLASDVVTKSWAKSNLENNPNSIPIWKNHVAFVLAKNKGGAWGLLQTADEAVRRPFFLLVSIAAIAFIVTLYRKLQPRQVALKWGLPLVLGGALGNVFDRIRYGSVIDFIDAHVQWKGHDHHWPTFNVADIAICVGVALMAVDMFTSRRQTPPVEPEGGAGGIPLSPPPPPDAPSVGAPAADTKT